MSFWEQVYTQARQQKRPKVRPIKTKGPKTQIIGYSSLLFVKNHTQRYVNDIFCMKIFDTKYANFESICDNLSIALEVQPHSDNQ